MKSLQIFAISALLILILPLSAMAQTSVVVVDVQRLLTQSQAAENIQVQIKTRRETLQSQFAQYESELRSNEQELVSQRNDLSPEAFNQKRQDFERDLVKKQRLFQGQRRALEEGVVKATAKLRGEIAKIVADLSDANDYDIVLTRQSVVIAAKAVDITEAVMTRLNESVTAITLEVADP